MAVWKCHAYERFKIPSIQKFSACETLWIYSVRELETRLSVLLGDVSRAWRPFHDVFLFFSFLFIIGAQELTFQFHAQELSFVTMCLVLWYAIWLPRPSKPRVLGVVHMFLDPRGLMKLNQWCQSISPSQAVCTQELREKKKKLWGWWLWLYMLKISLQTLRVFFGHLPWRNPTDESILLIYRNYQIIFTC